MTKVRVPQAMAVLPLRNSVFFPQQIMPLSIGRESSIRVIEEALKDDGHVVIVAQIDGKVEKPSEKDIYWVGTLAKVLKQFTLPDGTRSVLMQGIERVQLLSILHAEPYLRAVVRSVDETVESGLEIEAMTTNIKNLFQKAVEYSPSLTEEHLAIVLNAESPGAVADIATSLIPGTVEEKQKVLETFDLRKKLEEVTLLLTKLVQKLELGSKIQSEVQDGINKTQREYYLREQLKAIKKELGEDDENVEQNELRKRLDEAKLPEEARRVAEKELKRLSQMNPAAAEYTVSRTYLDWILDLPWSISTEDNLDIKEASKVLDQDHYGLDKVKKRILEYLAVRKLKNDMRGPIMVFVGPDRKSVV